LTASDVVAAVREQNVQVAAGAIGQQPVAGPVPFELVINAAGEGEGQGFNPVLLEAVEAQTDLPLLAFGGLALAEQMRPLLSRPQLAGVVVGNALNYREHGIGQLKASLTDQPLRPHRQRCSV
jgi:imidazole glycerol phosphate synthase subunit HisF